MLPDPLKGRYTLILFNHYLADVKTIFSYFAGFDGFLIKADESFSWR